LLASLSHISAGSPCRGAGSVAYTNGVDIDGEAWASPPSIGCDEYHAGAVTGPLTVAIRPTYTLLATGIEDDFTALIDGRVSASQWEFDDGTVVSNQPYASRTWAEPGDYPVVLRAYNETYPTGVIATVIVQVRVQPLHYVALNSTNPVAPYGSWATAATNIQDAVNVASPNALVLVSNGVYRIGSRPFGDGGAVRVALTKALGVQSVNGPAVTAIAGEGGMGCAYLTNGAVLTGFTLTNGAAGENGGGGVWCEPDNVVVSNCVLTGNSADYGGGAYRGTLTNCTLTGNSASQQGGGAYLSTLNNCMLSGNSAFSGGGAYQGTLNNCAVFCSSAYQGGGTYQSTLNNCTLTGNSADDSGGGTFLGTLNNCIVYFNTASSDANFYGTNLNYCCTIPMPTNGTANITNNPELASLSHISSNSPCRGAGNITNATGVDIDGEAWADPPSIGCDEYNSGSVTGALTVAIRATYLLLATGMEDNLTALIDGRVSASQWEFDEDTVVSNQPYVSHTWTEPGDYPVVLRAFNESYPTGVIATVIVQVRDLPVHYVALNSTNPVLPFGSWDTAATNIQDAVNAASPNALVLVSNGVYSIGSRMQGGWTVRVAVTKALGVQSVNGPAVTAIDGASEMGCAYLTNGAVLAGFTLANGAAGNYGGGVWCETDSAVVSNCVLTGNSADYGGGAYRGTLNNCTLTGNWAYEDGGGAYQSVLNNCALASNSASTYGGGVYDSTLNNCTLSGNSITYYGGASCYGTLNNCALNANSAYYYGGGAFGGTLNNCTLAGNAASYGGGTYQGTRNNCIIYYNTASSGPNYLGGNLNYCCTTPRPSESEGCITNAPLFVDLAGGNLRLQTNSPCIDAGANLYVVGDTDLDGRARIVNDIVDMGAYEWQPLSDFQLWLQYYGLPTDGTADYTDPDGDGKNNWEEWCCLTDPTNALSVLQMLATSNSVSGVIVTWQSVEDVTYFLERSTNLMALPAFQTVATNIIGQPDTTSYTDTNAVGSDMFFYRVGVE
jgi:parallel beta-helix repeat protein